MEQQTSANKATNQTKTVSSNEAAPQSKPYDEIAYIPGDGDPVRTIWNGVAFTAMVPVKVERSKTVLVPIREQRELMDGNVVSQAVERRVPMVDLARTNSHFMVNGERPARKSDREIQLPTSPEEYRGYAIEWIVRSTDARAMDARWEAEKTIRERCGVNDGDIAWLRPFFEARFKECGGVEGDDVRAAKAAHAKRWGSGMDTAA